MPWYYLILLPIIYALLNRGRGSNAGLFNIRFVPFLCKLLAGGLIGGLALWQTEVNHIGFLAGKDIPWWSFLSVMLAAYWLGECSGWSKYQGGLLNYHYWEQFEKYAHDRLAFALMKDPSDVLWCGSLANWSGADQVKEPALHCVVALAFRGAWWWVGPIGLLAGFGIVKWYWAIIALVAISCWFPLSVGLAVKADWKPFLVFKGASPTDKWGAHSELIYGFIQGVCLMGMFLI